MRLLAIPLQPCFWDWVDELSQVAGTIRSGNAIGVDSIPPEVCRVARNAYWCQLAENGKQVAIKFLMHGKEASCVVSQESQESL